jgi:hypothetical protein
VEQAPDVLSLHAEHVEGRYDLRIQPQASAARQRIPWTTESDAGEVRNLLEVGEVKGCELQSPRKRVLLEGSPLLDKQGKVVAVVGQPPQDGTQVRALRAALIDADMLSHDNQWGPLKPGNP